METNPNSSSISTTLLVTLGLIALAVALFLPFKEVIGSIVARPVGVAALCALGLTYSAFTLRTDVRRWKTYTRSRKAAVALTYSLWLALSLWAAVLYVGA